MVNKLGLARYNWIAKNEYRRKKIGLKKDFFRG